MIVAVVLQADAMRGLDDRQPLRGRDLVGANDARDLVVEHFGRSARQRAEARVFQLGQESSTEMPSVAAPCVISSGEKAWIWMSGHRLFDGAADREIGRAGIVGMDAALQTDLDRAALPGLDVRR